MSIDTLRDIIAAKRCGRHTWREIGDFLGKSPNTIRVHYYKHRDEILDAGPCPFCSPDIEVVGLKAFQEPDPQLWERAFAIQDRYNQQEEQRKEQYIKIPGEEPFAWAWLSDLHPGGAADYRQMRADAEIIRDTDRMWAAFNGDGPNNWIIGKLQGLQRGQSLSHDGEWQIFLAWLRILLEKDKLKVISLGNHDLWTLVLSGVDRIRREVQTVELLYDEHEVVYRLILENASWIVKQRHQWKGSSVHNPTHGIEVGWKRGDSEFDIGVGSHTHIGTLCRSFIQHDKRRYAVLLGAYALGSYGRELGVPATYGCGCGAMVFQPDGTVTFFNDLKTAARFLEFLKEGK